MRPSFHLLSCLPAVLALGCKKDPAPPPKPPLTTTTSPERADAARAIADVVVPTTVQKADVTTIPVPASPTGSDAAAVDGATTVLTAHSGAVLAWDIEFLGFGENDVPRHNLSLVQEIAGKRSTLLDLGEQANCTAAEGPLTSVTVPAAPHTLLSATCYWAGGGVGFAVSQHENTFLLQRVEYSEDENDKPAFEDAGVLPAVPGVSWTTRVTEPHDPADGGD